MPPTRPVDTPFTYAKLAGQGSLASGGTKQLVGLASTNDLHAVGKKKKPGARMWLRIDIEGDTEVLEVDKYAIMSRAQIPGRDLRVLGPLMSNTSTILGRERAIVLNLEHVKAIITAEEVLLLNANTEQVIPFVEELRRRLRLPLQSPRQEVATRSSPTGGSPKAAQGRSLPEALPFEFRVLEVALEAVCSFLDARTSELESDAYPALDQLTASVTAKNLERVRTVKSRIVRLSVRVQKVRDELEQLLDDDGDMADMYLTRKQELALQRSPSRAPSSVNDRAFTVVASRGSPPESPFLSRAGSRRTSAVYAEDGSASDSDSDSDDGKLDVEELEMLLESYFMQIESSLNKLNTLQQFIHDTEDYINIELDNQRNLLLTMQLLLTVASFAIAAYTVVMGYFGMNIPIHYYHVDGVFVWVVGWSLCGIVALFAIIVGYARWKRLIGV